VRIFGLSYRLVVCKLSTPPHLRDISHVLLALRSLQVSGQAWMRKHVTSPLQVQQATFQHAKTLNVDLSLLPPVIHIAGSKGKGSTAAICESLLRKGLGLRTGLFTSPHLVSPIERFQIKGEFVDEALFLSEFWTAWDSLGGPADASSEWSGPSPPLPGFNLLTLLAFKLFTNASCDVVVLETGLGGRFDATNVVPRPIACAITTLDLEHVDLLGPTLKDIAWQKGGIIKRGVPCVTSPQAEEAMQMLSQCAKEVDAPLFLCPPHSSLLERARLHSGTENVLDLGMEGRFQLINTSIAITLVDLFLKHQASNHKEESRKFIDKKEKDYSSHITNVNEISPSLSSTLLSSSQSSSFQTNIIPPFLPPPPVFFSSEPFSEKILTALREARFEGRAQILDVELSKDGSNISNIKEAARDSITHRSINNIVPRVPLSEKGNVRLYIDGSHTYLSTIEAALWFSESSGTRHTSSISSSSSSSPLISSISSLSSSLSSHSSSSTTTLSVPIRRILIFNCGLDKDTVSILSILTRLNFDSIYFVPTVGGISAPPTINTSMSSCHHPLSARAALERYKTGERYIKNKDMVKDKTIDTNNDENENDVIDINKLEADLTIHETDKLSLEKLKWQQSLAQLWKGLCRTTKNSSYSLLNKNNNDKVYVEESAEAALHQVFVKSCGDQPSCHVFVTGSLYLVGDVLRVVKGNSS
jgi:folylpolyglutamate synthase/dihydrofolate synthase